MKVNTISVKLLIRLPLVLARKFNQLKWFYFSLFATCFDFAIFLFKELKNLFL